MTRIPCCPFRRLRLTVTSRAEYEMKYKDLFYHKPDEVSSAFENCLYYQVLGMLATRAMHESAMEGLKIGRACIFPSRMLSTQLRGIYII